mgnify:CR=1 FL=1
MLTAGEYIGRTPLGAYIRSPNGARYLTKDAEIPPDISWGMKNYSSVYKVTGTGDIIYDHDGYYESTTLYNMFNITMPYTSGAAWSMGLRSGYNAGFFDVPYSLFVVRKEFEIVMLDTKRADYLNYYVEEATNYDPFDPDCHKAGWSPLYESSFRQVVSTTPYIRPAISLDQVPIPSTIDFSFWNLPYRGTIYSDLNWHVFLPVSTVEYVPTSGGRITGDKRQSVQWNLQLGDFSYPSMTSSVTAQPDSGCEFYKWVDKSITANDASYTAPNIRQDYSNGGHKKIYAYFRDKKTEAE